MLIYLDIQQQHTLVRKRRDMLQRPQSLLYENNTFDIYSNEVIQFTKVQLCNNTNLFISETCERVKCIPLLVMEINFVLVTVNLD